MSPENCQLLEDFAAWLRTQRHTLMPLKQWEALRWQSPAGDGARIMYTDKKGTIGGRFGDESARTDWADFLQSRDAYRPTALKYDDTVDLEQAFTWALEGAAPGDETLRQMTAEAVASFGRQAANLAQGAAMQGLTLKIVPTPKGTHIIVEPTKDLSNILQGE